MRFGTVPVAAAEGALLAHSLVIGGRRWRKGLRLGADDVTALLAAGVEQVIAALPVPDDLAEDEAARAVAEALRFEGIATRPPATGRVNLHAAHAGVFVADRAIVDAVNAVDPAVTLATLAGFTAVAEGQMVATVKIVPFAVPGAAVSAVAAAAHPAQAFAVRPFRSRRVGLVQTLLPGLKATVLEKTRRVTEARLARSRSVVAAEARVPHGTEATARAIGEQVGGCDLVIVFGASAVSDANDVVPAAIRMAGGEVLRVGMPVDPGNLLVLGRVGGTPLVGAPGCARSPKENGFDWVLDRICADIPVTGEEIAGMGVGGLLAEIATRPEPRETGAVGGSAKVHAVLLAAGRSSRMGGSNKLMAEFEGQPLLRRVAGRLLASKAAGAVVVTGHEADRAERALSGLPVTLAHNADFASGLASSLQAGIAALPEQAAGALIVLGDMPDVQTADLDRMVETFVAAGANAVVRATAAGRQGNPVILPRALFPKVFRLEGDTGARHLVEQAPVIDVELGEGAALDVDTPEAMARAGGTLQG